MSGLSLFEVDQLCFFLFLTYIFPIGVKISALAACPECLAHVSWISGSESGWMDAVITVDSFRQCDASILYEPKPQVSDGLCTLGPF